jgi:biopolymer transport protein ExbD
VHIPDQDGGVEEVAINLTPMIDVVFLLLIFFMVATTFLDPEREIEIDLPPASSAGMPEEQPNEIVINVLRDGSLQLGQREVDGEGLDSALTSAAARDPRTPVTIRGDRLVAHESIVGVMDACGRAGLVNLAVGTLTPSDG